MRLANKNILTVKPYVPGKPIEDVKRELGLKSVIKLASNENPYPPSRKVLAALSKAARDVNRYPDGSCFLLRQALSKFLKVRHDQLIFGNGSDEVLVLAVKAFVAKGDEVIVAKPSFLVYDLASRLAGARVQSVPLKDFCYDLKAMQAKINTRTRIIFIGNPDNPGGTYVNTKDLEGFIRRVPKDVLVIVDEAYFEYVLPKDYPDGIVLAGKYPNVLATRTFSKMYGLAGLRAGYGVASPKLIDILNRLREPFNVNSMAQAAAVAALKDQAHYQKIARKIEAQRQYLYRSLTALNIAFVRSFTNFILVFTGGDSRAAARAMLKKGVIIRDMSAWGMKGYIRVSIGTASENKRLLKTLSEVL